MRKFSTIVYVVDNQKNFSETLIDLNLFLDDIDNELQQFFGGREIEASSSLVDRTLARIKNS
jgi:hypothetical protein